jgi:FkbM family methyltransferase
MSTWVPPWSLEEKIRKIVIPAPWHLSYRVWREKVSGEREIALLPFLCGRNLSAIDVGANVGVWSHEMRRFARKVYAFEPNPKIFERLRAGLRGNDVEISPLALSSEAGEAALMVPKGKRGYSNQGATLSKEKIGLSQFGSMNVTTVRLDDLDIKDIGCIKIDVEGHELAVIHGATQTIAKYKPNLIVEIEEKHTKRDILHDIKEIKNFGYDAFCLLGGSLVNTDRVDMDRHHRSASSRADYVFNWIFLARS